MNLRTRDMRRAAALVLDAAAEVASLLGGNAKELEGAFGLTAHEAQTLVALHVANEAWQAAQLAAPESKRKPFRRKPKSKAKRQATADVREAVVSRALGWCEAPGCGARGTDADHFFGRARAESVESVWFLCRPCHDAKHAGRPNAATWLERFRAHCIKHSYWEEAKKAGRRLAYVQAREQLGEKLKAGGAR